MQVLREDILVLNYPKEFVILDNEDQKQLIRKIYDCGLTSTNYNGTFRYPSRFIFNIDKNLLSFESEIDQNLVLDALSYIEISEKLLVEDNEDILSKDTRVSHKVFGEGLIIEHTDGNNYSVKFDKFDTIRTISRNVLNII